MHKTTLPPAPFLKSSSDLHMGKVFALFLKTLFESMPFTSAGDCRTVTQKVLLHGSFAEAALWRTSGKTCRDDMKVYFIYFIFSR